MTLSAQLRRAPALVLLLLAGGACSSGAGGSGESGAEEVSADGESGAGTEARSWACDIPIGWKVGFVDVRFGIAGADLRSAIAEAVALWEDAAGQRLFQHQPVGGMPVDLEFDERQRELDEMAREERQLDDWTEQLSQRPRTQAEAERYNQLVERYNAALDAYESRPVLQFQVAEYSHSVEPRSGRAARRRITVWAMEGRSGLVSALAHELGHALGLEHVSEPAALMTAEGEAPRDKSTALHAADLEELRRVCRVGK